MMMKITTICMGVLLMFAGCKEKEPTIATTKADAKMVQEETKERNYEEIDLAYVMGKFEPSTHDSFVEIPLDYADQTGRYMRKDAMQAFIEMADSAKTDGVNLIIKSAARNFNIQKQIWEKKWSGQTILSDGTNAAKDIKEPKQRAIKILEYSSMPGTSRHHWGTDIDLNSFNNDYFATGKGLAIYKWLTANAAQFGFYQPYTEKGPDRPHGYNEEKWHWSYSTVSDYCTDFARHNLRPSRIGGFEGAEVALEIGVVDRYVLGVAKH